MSKKYIIATVLALTVLTTVLAFNINDKNKANADIEEITEINYAIDRVDHYYVCVDDAERIMESINNIDHRETIEVYAENEKDTDITHIAIKYMNFDDDEVCSKDEYEISLITNQLISDIMENENIIDYTGYANTVKIV